MNHKQHLTLIALWSTFFTIILGNILFLAALLPFLTFIPSFSLYILLSLIGLLLGFIYSFLITDIGIIEKKHHRWMGILIPTVCLINIIIIISISNIFNTQKIQNIWIPAGIFIISLMLPYILKMIPKKLNLISK